MKASALFFGCLLVCGSATATYGQLITGVNGTIANGNAVTISGTGFGTKSHAAPWLFDDFESGASDGADIVGRHTPVGNIEWLQMFGDVPSCKYDNAQRRTGAFSAYQYDNSDSAHDQVISCQGLASKERYLSYWFRWAGGSGVWKMDRTTSGSWNNPPYDSAPNSGWGDYAYVNNCSEFLNLGWETDQQTASTWHFIEVYYSLSDAGVANGSYQVWFDGRIIHNSDRNIMTLSSAWSTISGCKAQIDTWISPMIANNTSAIETWIDDIYMDDTRSRVVLGNSSSYATCTFFEPQLPTDWTTSSISFTVKQGLFATGVQAWLYVVDANGSASPGFQVTTGQGMTVEAPGQPSQPVRAP